MDARQRTPDLVRIETQGATHPASHGLRSTLAGIIVNLCLAILKGIAGVVGSSYALIADAIESMTDDIEFVRGLYRPSRRDAAPGCEPSVRTWQGRADGRCRGSVGLFAAAIAIAIESIHEIRTPHTMPAPFTLLVLPAVVIAKETMFRFVNRVGHSIESGAVKTDAWHHRSDAITSALAFVGISIALIGGPGWESADDWAALLASGIIGFNAYLLLKPAIQELGDALPGTRITQQIQPIAAKVPGVIEVEKCFVRKMGFDYYVDLHVVVEGELPVRRGHEIAHQVKDAIKSAYPMVADVSFTSSRMSATKRGAVLVAAGILLSRLSGLIRLRVFSHYFGITSDAADAFNAAFRIPNFLQNLFGEGVLSASFIPVYAGLLARKNQKTRTGSPAPYSQSLRLSHRSSFSSVCSQRHG